MCVLLLYLQYGTQPGLEVQGVLLQLGSGVGVEVLMAGEEAREDFLESALISGFSSGMLHLPLMCSNSCTCGPHTHTHTRHRVKDSYLSLSPKDTQ